jgi:tellurite resistance protein TerC
LKRLVYLSIGLSVVLAFIGVKLVLHAMHENELAFINGGHHIEWAPEIPIWFSLGFIIVTLGITTIASLRHSRNMPRSESAGGGELDEATPVVDSPNGKQDSANGKQDSPTGKQDSPNGTTGSPNGKQGADLDDTTRAELDALRAPEETDAKKS